MSPEIISPSAGESPDVGGNALPQQDVNFTEQININGVVARVGYSPEGNPIIEIPPDMDEASAQKWQSDQNTQNQVKALTAAQKRNVEAKQTLADVDAKLEELRRREQALLNGSHSDGRQQPSKPQTLDERIMARLGVSNKDDLDLVFETDRTRYHTAFAQIAKEDAMGEMRAEFQGTIQQMALAQEVSRDGNEPEKFQSWCASKGAAPNRAMYDLFKQVTATKAVTPRADDYNRIADMQKNAPMFVRQGSPAGESSSAVEAAVERIKQYANGNRL